MILVQDVGNAQIITSEGLSSDGSRSAVGCWHELRKAATSSAPVTIRKARFVNVPC